MDIYQRKTQWKLYLAVAGVAIILVSMVYTNYLTDRLAEEERNKVRHWVMAQEYLNDIDDEDIKYCDVTLHAEILKSNSSIPVILVNDRGEYEGANFGDDRNFDKEFLKSEVAEMRAEGFEPIQGFAHSIYYKESKVLRQLRFFPFIQLLLIAAFIGFGYVGFSSARRAEQNRVWVGMAKETAHQLGTPISAIVAWIEHLKLMLTKNEEAEEVISELRKDVSRLELIADRFSKIGSEPVLKPINIYEELDACRAYMARRAPRKVSFYFPDPDQTPMYVRLNPPLFDWVIENLLRNALDAMEGRGDIRAEVYDDDKFVYIDLTDTGKGIPSNKFKTVFQPGYTTKKRGWGLGLSLVKRIIEGYHSGKIFVKWSEEGKGTTFTIRLQKHTAEAPARSASESTVATS